LVTDGHPWQDSHVRAEPHFVAYPDGRPMHIGAVARVSVVVQRGEYRVVPDQGVVADADATLVLELASGVDEDAGAQRDVLAEVGVQRRAKRDGLIHGLPDQSGEQLTHLPGRLVAAIELRGDAPPLLARLG